MEARGNSTVIRLPRVARGSRGSWTLRCALSRGRTCVRSTTPSQANRLREAPEGGGRRIRYAVSGDEPISCSRCPKIRDDGCSRVVAHEHRALVPCPSSPIRAIMRPTSRDPSPPNAHERPIEPRCRLIALLQGLMPSNSPRLEGVGVRFRGLSTSDKAINPVFSMTTVQAWRDNVTPLDAR